MFSLLLILAIHRPARAEESVSYKFQYYGERDGRIIIRSHYAFIEKDLSPDTRIRVQGVVDAISGASPTGQPAPAGSSQVPLATLTDERLAGLVDLAHQFPRHLASVQVSYSDENDYKSVGVSLNDRINFNQKNTILHLGYAHIDDDVQPVFFSVPRAKQSDDFIIGVTQIASQRTSVTANLSLSRTRGYLGDPYKIIRKNTEILPGLFLPLTFPENRPDSRDKWVVLLSMNHAVPSVHGALEASFRRFDDDWGIRSTTLQLSWFQRLGPNTVLQPILRYYEQGAADFYMISLDGNPIVPGSVSTGMAPFYSSDYRLSKFRALTLGLKLVVNLGERATLDAAYENYDMNGRDGVTPKSAFATADIFTVGLRLWY